MGIRGPQLLHRKIAAKHAALSTKQGQSFLNSGLPNVQIAATRKGAEDRQFGADVGAIGQFLYA
jgi:hypothetical protein